LPSWVKFQQDDPRQGIFLVATDKTEVRVERILSHHATQIVFLVPVSLPADGYSLEVHILPKGNKELKKGILMDILTVNN
jgi:hypothetical protein